MIVDVNLQGQSMGPFFQSGEKVKVHFFESPVRASQFLKPESVGHVFVYRCNKGEMICHRFLGFDHHKAVFKGDGSYLKEEYLHLTLWGEVLGVYVKNKYYMDAAYSPKNFYFQLLSGMLSRKRWVRVFAKRMAFVRARWSRFFVSTIRF